MADYWKDRMAAAQNKLTEKKVKQIDNQLKKYYATAAKTIIADFETTYNKVLNAQIEGKQVTPADLYKLDKYWQMQGDIREKLRKLGEKQVALLTKQFELQFFDIYYSINIEGSTAFNTVDTSIVRQIINQVWCADGKSWSQRIWGNLSLLQTTLNDNLINCVATGKKPTQLVKLLQKRFKVSYGRAKALVVTETAHLQTRAAQQRYEDYGIKEVQFWADPDERRCKDCGALHKKIYPASQHVPIPLHTRCRCCVIPLVKNVTL